MLLPLILGALAIYLLLPRPRPYPTWWGALTGTAALVLAGLRLVATEAASVEAILFYIFSGIAVVSGTMLISVVNPARAALSFTLVVLSTCGLFLLLAAPFLMAATVIVYAGAIVVTFLFVIMLAQQAGVSDADARSREPLLAALTGFILLGAILYVLERSHADEDIRQLITQTRRARAETTPQAIQEAVGEDAELFRRFREALEKRGMTDLRDRVINEVDASWPGASAGEMQGHLGTLEEIGGQALARVGLAQLDPRIPRRLSAMSGPAADTPPAQVRRDATGRPHMPHENAAHVGKSLFTDYLLPVELGGLLLLVAVVGAIAISHRHATEETRS